MVTTSAVSPQNTGRLDLRLQVAMHVQEIEGNPLDAADRAMFEMFDREGWSFERRRAFIASEARGRIAAE